MPELTFELACLDQAQAIIEMRKASSPPKTAAQWRSRLRYLIGRIKATDPENLRRATLYVACEDGQVVGSVVVTTFPPSFWKKQYWCEPKAIGLGVHGLLVHPDCRGKGIGGFLMRGVETLAAAHGIQFVRLDAYAENGAGDFYRKLGYEERAVIDLRGTGLILFEKRTMRLPSTVVNQVRRVTS